MSKSGSRGSDGIPYATALKARRESVEIDAKRKPGTSGPEAWYPYYAGFSESFARVAVEAASLKTRAHVLDPWNGCGTTTRVADSLGYTALGVDINPVAVLVASAKLARSQDAIHVMGLASRLASHARVMPKVLDARDPLRRWLCRELTSTYRAIERGILADLATRAGSALDPSRQGLPPLASFLLLALQRAARQFAGIKTTSNPTWLRPKRRPPRHEPESFTEAWLELVQTMAVDLEAAERVMHRTGSQVLLADSRALPLDDNSIDLVVTSPPYCTRIDYVVSTSFELAALGVGESKGFFGELRRDCMGTPLARPAPAPAVESFPASVQRILRAIQQHPSKSSSSYYYKTYAQYFEDSLGSLRELSRVLRPGGLVALVVQSSYYKDVYIDLPALYMEMARALSLKADLALEYDVNRFLAQINSRSSAHRKSTTHREAVVVLEAA